MKRDGDPAAGQTSAALVDGNRVIAVRDLDKRDSSADVLDLIERPLPDVFLIVLANAENVFRRADDGRQQGRRGERRSRQGAQRFDLVVM